MTKNGKLLYCLLGSAVLALLGSPMLEPAINGVFSGAFQQFVALVADILSFIGFILLIIFALMLLYYNTKKM